MEEKRIYNLHNMLKYSKEGLLNREVELIPCGKKDSDKKGLKIL